MDVLNDPGDDEEDWIHLDQEVDALSLDKNLAFFKLGHHALTHNFQKAISPMEQAHERNEPLSLAKTPSRLELLSIVRKHSSFLEKPVIGNTGGGSDYELDMRFWRELVDMFFVRGMTELKTPQSDDLVFFVHHMYGMGQNYDKPNMQPYFVRRWAPQLEKVVGENAMEVDWRRSLYLNLIAHTSYNLTVAICSREALQNHPRNTGIPLTPIYKISKTVYASPSRVNFHRDMSKGIETVPAYPDICFMVDDYDNTFEAVILSEPDHCYCVLLSAHGGAAFPPVELQEHGTMRISPENQLLGESQCSNGPKLTLFSGFVSYEMVRTAFEGGRSNLGGLLLVGSSSARSEHLIMRGPGGRGEVDVSVSGLPDEGTEHKSVASSAFPPKSGAKMAIGTIMRKAAIAASAAAKQAYVAAATGIRSDMEPLPLRCCLMSLTLPWDVLAHDLLFKGLPNKDN